MVDEYAGSLSIYSYNITNNDLFGVGLITDVLEYRESMNIVKTLVDNYTYDNRDKFYATSRAFLLHKQDKTITAWGNQDFGGTIPSNVSNQNVKEVVSDLYNFAVKYDDEKISIWGKATMDAEFIDITPDVGLNYDFVNFEENKFTSSGGISSGIAYNVFESTERLESTKGDLIWKSNGFSIDPLKRHEMYLSVDFDEYTESLEGNIKQIYNKMAILKG